MRFTLSKRHFFSNVSLSAHLALRAVSAALLAITSVTALLCLAAIGGLSVLPPSTGQTAQSLFWHAQIGQFALGAFVFLLILITLLSSLLALQNKTLSAPRAMLRAWTKMTRLTGAVMVPLVFVGFGLLFWYVASVVGLVYCLVHLWRTRASLSGVRRWRVLIWAVPFFPVLYGLFLVLPIVVVVDRAHSVRGAVREAHLLVGTQTRAVFLAGLTAAVAGVGVGWFTVRGFEAVSGQGNTVLGAPTKFDFATVGGILIVFVGLALALTLVAACLVFFLRSPSPGDNQIRPSSAAPLPTASDSEAATRRPRAFSALGTAGMATLRGTALVVVATLIITVGLPSAAIADTAQKISPKLTVSLQGNAASQDLLAEVIVPGGSSLGTIQFFDNGTTLGAPITLSGGGDDASYSLGRLESVSLSVGSHKISFTFMPDDPALVASGRSNIYDWFTAAESRIVVTAPAGASLFRPVDLTVSVVSVPPGAVSGFAGGDVTVKNGTTSATLTLTKGLATWHLAQLNSEIVTGSYNGDYEYQPATLSTTLDVGQPASYATTMQSSASATSVALGNSITIAAKVGVIGPDSVIAAGTVEIISPTSGLALATGTLAGGSADLVVPTSGFPLGLTSYELHYLPSPGFDASSTTQNIFIDPATTSIRFSPTLPTRVAQGKSTIVTVLVTSSDDSRRSAYLTATDEYGAETAIGTTYFTVVNGTGTADFELQNRLPVLSTYTLRASVDQDDRHLSAYAPVATIQTVLDSTPTTTRLQSARDGDWLVYSATVNAQPNFYIVSGTVSFFVNGVYYESVSSGDRTNVYTLRYRPTTGTPTVVTARYQDPTINPRFAPSEATSEPYHYNLTTGNPTATWTDSTGSAPIYSDSELHLVYPGVAGFPTPTGRVDISNLYSGQLLASAELKDGRLDSRVTVNFGTTAIRAVYSGDGNYRARNDFLPDLVFIAPDPVFSFTAPTTVALGQPALLNLGLTGIDLNLISSVTVTDTDQYGATTTLPGSYSNANAQLNETLSVGKHTFVATITFASFTGIPSQTVTRTTTVTVDDPTLTLEVVTPPDAQVVGAKVKVLARAGQVTSGGTGLDRGSFALLTIDGVPSRLTQPWIFDASGASAAFTLTLSPGAHELTVTSVYGRPQQVATSTAVSVLLAPQQYFLSTTIGAGPTAQSRMMNITANRMDRQDNSALIGFPQSVLAEVSMTDSSTPDAAPVVSAATLHYNPITGQFTGSVAQRYWQAGTVTAVVTLKDSSAYIALASVPATGTSTFVVSKNRSTITFFNASANHQWGTASSFSVDLSAPTDGPDYQLLAIPYNPQPSQSVTVSLADSEYTCVVALPSGSCSVPFEFTKTGVNLYTASFNGDANNAAAVQYFQQTELIRISGFSIRNGSTASAYTAGDPFSPKWIATAAGPDLPQGVVTATLGSASCSAPVAEGTCTLQVPDFGADLSVVPYSLRFTPADYPVSPIANAQGAVQYNTCQPFFVQSGSYTIDSGRTCGEHGVVAGTIVSLIAPERPDYAVDYWIDGGTHYSGTSLYVRTPFYGLLPIYRYAPVCYTLSLFPNTGDPLANNPDRSLGTVVSFTPPNCADPIFPSDEEKELLAKGQGRYSAGTTVLVAVSSDDGAGLTLDRFDGVDGVYNNGVGTVLMNADRTVIGHFKPAHCLPVPIVQSVGGTVTVVSSIRGNVPAGNIYSLPLDGRCTTAENQPGFIPGTNLTVRVQAQPGYGIESLLQRPNSPKTAAGPFTLTRSYSGLQNTVPNGALDPDVFLTPPASGLGPDSLTETIVVGKATTSAKDYYVTASGKGTYRQTSDLAYGFRFARIGCTPVVVKMAFFGTIAKDGTFAGTAPTYVQPQDDCTAIIPWTASTVTAVPLSSGYFSQTYTGYVSNAGLSRSGGYLRSAGYLSTNDTFPQVAITIDGEGSREFSTLAQAYLNSDPGADAGHPTYDAGIPTGALRTAGEVQMFIVWRHTDCFSPMVSTPDGGGYELSAIDFNYACADSSQFIANQPFVLAPTSLASGAQAEPVISIGPNDRIDHTQDVPSDRKARKYYPVGQPISVSSSVVQVRLNYCGQLRATIDFRDSAGRTITAVPADRFDGVNFTQTGSCPIGFGEVGKTTYVGLSDVLSGSDTVSLSKQFKLTYTRGWDSDKTEIARVPVPVALYGDQQYTTIRATIRCYRLDVGNTAVAKTPANCPGSTSDLYLPGSAVQVDAKVSSPRVFRHWTSTGAEVNDDFNAESAYVVMGSDRSVTAVTEVPGWGEAAKVFLSNVATRVVAFTVDVVIGALLAKISFAALSVVNLVVGGIAAGLGAAGAPASGVAWANRVTASLDLAVGQFGQLTKCTTAWANGTDSAADSNSRAQNGIGSGLQGGSTALSATNGVGSKLGSLLNQGDAIRRSQAAAIAAKLESVSALGSVASLGASLYSAFGSNVASYLSGDPARSWTSFGGSIGSCMKRNVADHLDKIR